MNQERQMNKAILFKLCNLKALCFFGSQGAFAQETSNVSSPSDTIKYLILEKNGTEYVGLIVFEDSLSISIRTYTLGEIILRKSEIESIQVYNSSIHGRAFNSGSVFSTRHLITTNSFPIRKGENYALFHLFGPEIHYAVHRDFSIGLLSTWIASPIAGALKYTHRTANPKINYGIGALFGSLGPITNFRGYGGLYWGMLTCGDRLNNVTVSVGYGHLDDRGLQTF